MTHVLFPRPNRRPSLQKRGPLLSHLAGRSVGTEGTKVAMWGLWLSQVQRGHAHLLTGWAQVSAGGQMRLQGVRAPTKRQGFHEKQKQTHRQTQRGQ